MSEKSVPKLSNSDDNKVSLYFSFLFMLFLGVSIAILVVICLMNKICKEKSLRFFRMIDLLPITGGTKKKYVGGIIMIFYIMFVIIIIFNFVNLWLFYNHKLESSEMTKLKHKSDINSSYKVEVTLYTSKLI